MIQLWKPFFHIFTHGDVINAQTWEVSPKKPQSSHLTERARNVSVKSKLQHGPPGHTPGIWHLWRPGEEGIWLSESSRGWVIWSPCFRGREFELHPRFHVKSLVWWAMGDAVLVDFRGKDCASVANWLRGKDLNKLCSISEVFKFKMFNIGFRLWMYECILLLCLQWNTIPIAAIQNNNKNKIK